MNGVVLTACLVSALLLTGCGKPDDAKIISDVKDKVTDKINRSYGGCENYKFLSNSTAPEFKNAYLLHCDNNLNPNDLSFSNMTVHRHDNSVAVCGVVSGKTDLSRQGVRFVELWGKDDGAQMQSKYSGRQIRDILGSPVDTYRNYYQKYCK